METKPHLDHVMISNCSRELMITRFILLSALVLPLVGCASTQDFCYKQSHKCSAHWRSIVTGNSSVLNCDYSDGWREGYFDYSTGRRCKPPTLPPKKYWSTCYQGCEGQKKISEWYSGYQKGMIEAEKVCGNCWHEIRPRSDCLPPGMGTSSFAETFTSVPPSAPAPSMVPSTPLVPQSEAVPAPVPIVPQKPTSAKPIFEAPKEKSSDSGSSPIFLSPSAE